MTMKVEQHFPSPSAGQCMSRRTPTRKSRNLRRGARTGMDKSMTLTIPDLESLRSSALADFEKQASAIPRDRGEDFAREVARLEGQLEAIYRLAVLLQRREVDMDAAY